MSSKLAPLVSSLWTQSVYSHEFPIRIRGPKGFNINISAECASDGKSFVTIIVKNASVSLSLALSKAQAVKLIESLRTAVMAISEHEVGEVHES